jgi:ribonuclease BN (tRNA processing enzyme)
VDLAQLAGVIVSHLHPDHWHDLPALRHALRARFGCRVRTTVEGRRIPLYVPASPPEVFAQLAGYSEVFEVRPLPGSPPREAEAALPCLRVELGPVEATFYFTRHALPAYAVSLAGGGKKLFYTGDTNWWEGLTEMARGADLLLSEASLLSADRPLLPDDHLTAEDAGRLASAAGARTLVLTHLWPEYPPEALLCEAARSFGGDIGLAQEGQVYRVG